MDTAQQEEWSLKSSDQSRVKGISTGKHLVFMLLFSTNNSLGLGRHKTRFAAFTNFSTDSVSENSRN